MCNLQLYQNKLEHLKILHGSMQAINYGIAYFAKAISYMHKMYTKLTTGVSHIEHFFFVTEGVVQ